MNNKTIIGLISGVILASLGFSMQAAPLDSRTLLTIEPGIGSQPNLPCLTGSCFGMQVAPGFIVWTDLSPGTDGGIVVGKAQRSGGQEDAPSATNNTPGEMTAAWLFFANYGTWFSAPGGELNRYDDTSCKGRDCLGKTELKAFWVAWNGGLPDILGSPDIPCLVSSCTPDQAIGSYVRNYTIDGGRYLLDYNPVTMSSFETIHIYVLLRGRVYAPPQLSGFWTGASLPVGKVVFLFGRYFNQPESAQPLVEFNGIPSPGVQVLSDDLLLALLPPGDTMGPITVQTRTLDPMKIIGTATSPTDYGVPAGGLSINGLWPGQSAPGKFVFVFGSGFVSGNTQVKILDLQAPLVQVADATLLIFMVPAGASSGPVVVTTPAGSVQSATSLVVQ